MAYVSNPVSVGSNIDLKCFNAQFCLENHKQAVLCTCNSTGQYLRWSTNFTGDLEVYITFTTKDEIGRERLKNIFKAILSQKQNGILTSNIILQSPMLSSYWVTIVCNDPLIADIQATSTSNVFIYPAGSLLYINHIYIATLYIIIYNKKCS